MVDDLKPVLGAYGDPAAFTPNMDMLAEKETADRGKKMCEEYEIRFKGEHACFKVIIK